MAAVFAGRRHRELSVLDFAEAADMARDRNVVGRVGKDYLSPLITEQGTVGVCLGGVATNELVITLACPAVLRLEISAACRRN